MRIGIVAGEASGDFLGAELMRGLQERLGEVEFEGIGGERMISQGLSSLYPMDKLSVMGLVEVLGSYLELSSVQNSMIRYFSRNPPDAFIGVDAPDFNLKLERCLRVTGIRTVHYVSPSVWAWRRYRIRRIARSVDLMLTLFPFELPVYRQHGINAECTGHPLAEKIEMCPDRKSARRRLAIREKGIVIGIMPGSRKNELRKLWRPFLLAAELCFKKNPAARFICSLLTENDIDYCSRLQTDLSLQHLPLDIYRDRAQDVLQAADVVLLASGTVTLEAMLFKRPMVVAYRLNPLTFTLVKMVARIEHASLPNLLAGREIVPECLQHQCSPQRLYEELQHWLENPDRVSSLVEQFAGIHSTLKTASSHSAADAVVKLLDAKRASCA